MKQHTTNQMVFTASRMYATGTRVLAGAILGLLAMTGWVGPSSAETQYFEGAYSIDGREVFTRPLDAAAIQAAKEEGKTFGSTAGSSTARGTEIVVFEEGFEVGFPNSNWEFFWNTEQSECLSPYRWDADQTEVFEGAFSAWCAGKSEKVSCSPELTPADGYPIEMQSIMIYGPLDLRDATAGRLELRYWIDSEINALDSQFDSIFWGINDQWLDGEGTFFGAGIRGFSDGWDLGSVDLTNVPTLGNVLGQNDVYLAVFFFSDNNDTNEPGAFCDQIRVIKEVPTPVCSIEGTPVEFGDVRVGETKDLTFTILNSGTGVLEGSIEFAGGENCDEFTLLTDPFYSLGGTGSKEFTVRFAPESVGNKTCTLDTGTGCSSIALTGSGSVNQPPELTHQPLTEATVNNGLTVNITANDGDPEDTIAATLFYRRGGDTSFEQAPFTGAGSSFTAAIPAGSVTTRGLEYYVEVSDGTAMVFAPFEYPTTDVPFQVPVTFQSQTNPNAQPAGTEQTAYRMISTPLALNDRGTLGVLGDDFGDYDREQWRFFRFEGDEFIEFAEAPATNLDRGKAYWLISKDGGTIDVGAGSSSPLDPLDIVLEPGWNDVAVPFDFPVDWDDVIITGAPKSEVDGPYGFDGSWVSPTNLTRMQPWRGYAVFNSGEGAPTLTFPVLAADGVVREASAQRRIDEQNWRVMISARVEEARDWDNAIGWSSDAIDGADRYDHREPRGMGGYVSLGVDRGGVSWTYDVRAPKSNGDTWRLRLVSSIAEGSAGSAARLTADLGFDVREVPSRFEARLWDPAAGREYDLRASHELELTLAGDQRGERELILIIGTPDYVASGVESVAMPSQYQVFVPSPNPSLGTTSIRYQLPADGQVDLSVYDSAGRRVAVLLSGWELAGDRRIVWNGRDRSGRVVPAGAYFVRMSARDYEGRQKFLIVR